ncbi:MAG: hypothetical protein WAM77_27720 [Xanthobacteraceae bacterium]|jgi:hypothetical protein
MVIMNTVPRSLVALSRALLVVATAGTLAGCFETTGASFTNPFATSALDPQAPPVAAQGGRGGTSDYLTADKAKSACWMQAETDKKAPKDLEKRGKWVDKCAAAKLRDQATQWASTNSQPAPAPAPSAAPFSFPGSLFGTPTSAPAEPRSSPSGADVQQKGM